MEETAVEQEPKATGEQASAEPVEKDLDALLNEFDEGTKPPEQKAEPKPEPEITEVLEFVRETQAEKAQADISEAVKIAKENEALSGVGDKVVRRYLEFEAMEDPRVKNAWLARKTNPQGWSQVLKGLGSKLASEIADPQLTADREAARNSVRGSSTQAPEEPKQLDNAHFDAMSDAEFQQEMRKHGYR